MTEQKTVNNAFNDLVANLKRLAELSKQSAELARELRDELIVKEKKHD